MGKWELHSTLRSENSKGKEFGILRRRSQDDIKADLREI
jgi:hypothetical protein